MPVHGLGRVGSGAFMIDLLLRGSVLSDAMTSMGAIFPGGFLPS
jgi:hypothetical protein